MPRRLNYTGRKKINRSDASVRLHKHNDVLSFHADLRNLTDYVTSSIVPPPRVYVEAYRGASTLWKRFDFGRVGALQPPDDRSLTEFAVPEGILFRVKVSAEGDTPGRLVAEADRIQPRMPDDNDDHGQPLIQHVPAEDIGDELWRIDFAGDMPLLKINRRVPDGVDQFLLDAQHRAIFAPAVMRQVLTRILIIEKDTGDEEDRDDWRQRWVMFSEQLPGVPDCPGVLDEENSLDNIERWIDTSVESFVSRTGTFARFIQSTTKQGQS